MKRLGRFLLDVATGMSLVLWAAVLLFTVRGIWVTDLIGWVGVRADGSRVAVWGCSGRGGLGMTVSSIPPGLVNSRGWSWLRRPPIYGGDNWPRYARGGLGFYALVPGSTMNVTVAGACVPAPAMVVLTGLLPVLWVMRYRRQRRLPPGWCAGCGYDLRATPERCPECGAVPGVMDGDTAELGRAGAKEAVV